MVSEVPHLPGTLRCFGIVVRPRPQATVSPAPMARTINGTTYATATDAAKHFGVSTKTINEWVRSGIVPPPPEVTHGAGVLRIYPVEYLREAERHLEEYRRRGGRAAHDA